MATASLDERTHSLASADQAGADRSAPRTGAAQSFLLISLESRAIRLAVITTMLPLALLLAWKIVRPAIADWTATRAVTIGDLERAVAWDPGNPELRVRLGTAYLDAAVEKTDLGAARGELEIALRQRPTDGATWLRLAVLAERKGQREAARRALETALRLDRHNVALRWDAAVLQLAWDEGAAAIEQLRYVLELDPAQRQVAFQLLRTLGGSGDLVERLLSSEPEALTALLVGALRDRDVGLAQAAWERRAPLQPSLPSWLQRRYMDFLVEEGQGMAARRAWAAIVTDPQADSRTNAVWNGGFESDALVGWGLDWHVKPVWGVDVRLDRAVAAEGRHSLRLAFNSFPTLDFAGVQQPVAVESGHRYRLRARAKAVDFVTRSGLKLEVVSLDGEQVLGATPPIAGTSDWTTIEGQVQIPAGVSFVLVRLRREKAPGPEGNLGGKVWVDDVSLSRG